MHYITSEEPCLQSDYHNSIQGDSFSLFTTLPADAKMFQTYLISCMNIGSFFFSYGTCVYTVTCVCCVFFGFSLVKRSSTRWDPMYWIATYLPWYFRLAQVLQLCLPWRSQCDLLDYLDTSPPLFVSGPRLDCSVPLLSKCCMVLTWPS